MIFSSIPFLYYFLPAVLAVYFLTPRRGKNAVLLFAQELAGATHHKVSLGYFKAAVCLDKRR